MGIRQNSHHLILMTLTVLVTSLAFNEFHALLDRRRLSSASYTRHQTQPNPRRRLLGARFHLQLYSGLEIPQPKVNIDTT